MADVIMVYRMPLPIDRLGPIRKKWPGFAHFGRLRGVSLVILALGIEMSDRQLILLDTCL